MLSAVAEETVYRNEDNGYTVLTVRAGKQRFSAVGIMPQIGEGECLDLEGKWVEHPTYGQQLKVESIKIRPPETKSGIERYLSSGLISGIRSATAKLIVDHFGDDALRIIGEEPERLLEISGIGKRRAALIAESYAAQAEEREAMLFLQKYSIPARLAVKIFRQYDTNVQEVITKNPFRLVEDIEGIGFKTADHIAAAVGIEKTSNFRIHAGLHYKLQEAIGGTGHCYLPRPELVSGTRTLLGVPQELVDTELDAMIISRNLIAEIVPDEETGQEVIAVYEPATYKAEKLIALRLKEYKEHKPKKVRLDIDEQIDALEREEGIKLHEQQRAAVRTAAQSGICLITGGPGTGKTTIIKCIMRVLKGQRVALAAPTGRAAKRMSEACGKDAKTLHRLLEYSGESERFMRDEDSPLELDALIIDEMSMVDIFLMQAVVKALSEGTRLIMVGDVDQLPSVGAGNVLRDLLSCGVFPVVRLSEIFRQNEKSMIVYNAHQINNGRPPRLNAKGSDFFFERQSLPTNAADTIVDLCATRLPKFLGGDAKSQIQVLAPSKKGDCGVFALNNKLQEALNPKSSFKNEYIRGDTTFRVGDKVMQTKNNYQMEWTRGEPDQDIYEEGLGVFNGDMGLISTIDPEEKTVEVLFDDDKVVLYGPADLEDLELAYCISVHKSQGNEFPAVVMPAVGGAPMLLTRNLLYTAVTRARKLVVIVGRESAIDQMIQNTHIVKRYSALKWRIMQLDEVVPHVEA
ncbi:MAG: ATP-dependent RecD-like DNA helicase [Clostridia bacterium]|nr:ATP-dependent RecD-like DNA helicase [Clostridia bacterium]